MTVAEEKPGIYVFHGEDERSMADAIADLEARIGDATTVALNKTVIEAREFDLDRLRNAASAMPFLAERRVVVVKNGIQKFTTPEQQEKFLALLLKLPLSTAVLLIEEKTLRKEHWIIKWSKAHKGRVYLRSFSLGSDDELATWINAQAQRLGGRVTPMAANALVSIIGNDTNLLYQEIRKLLTYVNFKRPVDVEDVNTVTVGPLQANIFVMVDALSRQDSKQALRELKRLFELEDPLQIFGMIVRQFRLLIMTAEILQEGGRLEDVMRRAGLIEFVAKKLILPAQRIGLRKLELAYHRLLELDAEIKRSLIEDQVGMESFVAEFTTRSD